MSTRKDTLAASSSTPKPHRENALLGTVCLLAVFMALLLAACIEGVNFRTTDVDRAYSNPRVRPDLQALTPEQLPPAAITPEDPDYFAPHPLEFFSRGGESRQELASSMAPDLPHEQLRHLHNPLGCYWMGENEKAILFWETVVQFETFDGRPLDPTRNALGTCLLENDTFNHPYDRGANEQLGIRFEDGDYSPVLGGDFSATEMYQWTFEPQDVHPYGLCTADQEPRNPIRRTESGGRCQASQVGKFASCMVVGCKFLVGQDSLFEARAIWEVGTPVFRAIFGPQLRVVSGSRTIARPLELLINGEPDPNSGELLYRYQWATDVSSGMWQENFSPNVQVETVRVFRIQIDRKEYLLPDRMTMWVDPGTPVTTEPDSSDNLLDEVPRRATPTYFLAPSEFLEVSEQNWDDRLEWRFDFLGSNPGIRNPDFCCTGPPVECCDDGICPPPCGSELTRGFHLYVEFTLRDMTP